MKRSLIHLAAAIGAGFATVQAATIDLTGLGYVQYGDAQSYSMPIANYQYGYALNNGPFAIPSTPGQIKDLVVLATGTNNNPAVTNFDGMDNAYETPDGNNSSSSFNPEPGTYRGTEGTVNNNLDTTWDTSLAALQSFLAGDRLVFFFNNNQINSGGAADQSLAAWARLWVTDDNGDVVTDSTFEFTNDDSPYNIVTAGGGGTFLGDVTGYTAGGSGAGDPDVGGAASTDFVLSGGAICVATGPGLPVPTPVPCGSTTAQAEALLGLLPGDVTTVSSEINHNLGADHVAYSILFPELNDLLDDLFANAGNLADYTLHVDVRLGCQDQTANWMDCSLANGYGTGLNNGYEQIFIGSAIVGTCPPDDPNCNPTVPEPGTLLLAGMGLAAFGVGYRRRRRAA